MLDALLKPRSIAVIGASRKPGSIGYEILDNLLLAGFRGPVYPVNPTTSSVHSVRSYAAVSDLPETPDLAVVVVPKDKVIEVVSQCGESGVGAVVVISAGFREVGGAGVERESRLRETVERFGMRMVGPNCMGIINTSPEVRMNATFAPTTPPRGPIAFMSQSGAMGVTILDYASEYGIGVSHFVSVGNKADVSGNDLLEYWREDDDVGVILMYLENFGDPRRFTRTARETTRRKPIIVVKAGRSGAGARAASSHTGALAALDEATDALFGQCGVIRVDTVKELFDAAMAFGNAPLPVGPKVAVVTNAGGPGIIIADACEARGLRVVPLSDASRRKLRAQLPEEASVANPVDMIASAGAEEYRMALEVVLRDSEVDAVIAAFVPPLGIEALEVARAIRAAAEGCRKPVLAVLMGREGFPQGRAELHEARIPTYIFPESAAGALAAQYRYRRWLERPVGNIARFEANAAAVEELLDACERDGRRLLALDEALRVLEAYGIPVARYAVAGSRAAAVAEAAELGCPVAMKAVSPRIVHKTEAGAVLVGLETAAEVGDAYERITAVQAGAGATRAHEVVVQEVLENGRETIVGMTMEPNFGPLLMFGLGGIYVEALGDVAFGVQPVSDVDADGMIRSLRSYCLLEGTRGEIGVDLAALRETIQRVSQLVGSHPRIRELDINPFLAFPRTERCAAVDARIRIDGKG
ncbi:MAG: acetate--CoA ligase family protein [Gemmatimonadota bacterium]